MRDMLGGFRIRDLDFVVEGHALKVAKALATTGARTIGGGREPQERGAGVPERRYGASRHVAPGEVREDAAPSRR